MKERRLGKVIVSGIFVHEHTETLAEVFAKIKAVALQIDHHYDADLFEYTLYSPFFEIIPKGSYAPKYSLEVTTHRSDTGKLIDFKVKAKKLPWDYMQPYSPTIMEMMLENERSNK